jgi:AcrR family transcriptional regulator
MAEELRAIARRPTTPGSSRGRARDGRRRAIDALVELLDEAVWDTISVSDVVERAALSRSTFYAHFVDRWDLMGAALPELLGGSTGPRGESHDVRVLLERAQEMRSTLGPVLGDPAIEHVHRLALRGWTGRPGERAPDDELVADVMADLMAGVFLVLLRRVVHPSRQLAAEDAHTVLMAVEAAIRAARAPEALRWSA